MLTLILLWFVNSILCPSHVLLSCLCLCQCFIYVYNRLHEVEWMSDETRKEAIKKMNIFGLKIGFPDKWVNYDSFQLLSDSTAAATTAAAATQVKSKLIQNYFILTDFGFQLDVNRMNQPVDRLKWEMTPQTINAYYHPCLNEIVFPAAILQPPFFNMDADDAVNYGRFM